jgi:hypothetical protein
MFLARGLRLVLAVALLAAWQGALLHPLEHLDRHGGFVHVAGTTHDPDEEGGPTALCDVIAAVAACVGESPALSFAAVTGRDAPDLFRGVAPRSAPPPAYRSQAPPALL